MAAKTPLTGVDLSDISSLFLRSGRSAGADGGAPDLSRHTVCLSYELATAAYTMDPDSWLQAGWRDFSMLVNRSLITGEMLNGTGSPLNDLTRATLQTLAKLKMSALNPVEQVLNLRQPEEESTSLKAIVMLRPGDGLMTVAIGFMGTGKQLGDWIPNMRMAVQDGLHEGFLQLAQEFTEKLPHIAFPCAAGLLDRPGLSLKDIIDSLKQPGSPFRLWVCGHSQGAAVMQVFVDQLLNAGVRAEYLCGIGFASPTVAHPGRAVPPGGYPVTHILNEDDLVPRVGAWLHLGECLVFTPSDADRLKMYGPAAQDPCTAEAHRQLQLARTAPDALMNGIAILRVLHQQSEASLRHVLGETEQKPFVEWLNAGEDNLLKLLDSLSGRLERGYLAVSGETALPEAYLNTLTLTWEALLRKYGAAAWVRAVKNACILPHRLYRVSGSETPAYFYIATDGLDRRHQGIAAAGPAVISGGSAALRPAARADGPGLSSGHVYRRAAVRKPVPASTRASRYASAFRLLAVSQIRKWRDIRKRR